MLLALSTCSILLLMGFQDIKNRSIMLLLFFFLAGFVTYTALLNNPASEVLTSTLINLFFVGVQLLAVFLYVVIRNRSFVNPFVKHLGLGDLLFWIAISPGFSPVNYILTFLASMVFALGAFLLMGANRQEKQTVPLAGLQALFYSGFFFINFLFLKVDCHDDSLLMSFLI